MCGSCELEEVLMTLQALATLSGYHKTSVLFKVAINSRLEDNISKDLCSRYRILLAEMMQHSVASMVNKQIVCEHIKFMDSCTESWKSVVSRSALLFHMFAKNNNNNTTQ